MKNSNFFCQSCPKLVFSILVFLLILLIYLLFLQNNLFSICKKLVMSFLKLLFTIFWEKIYFSILTINVFVGNLDGISVVEKVALIYVQWPGQKAKKIFVISIIISCFFIQGWRKIIRWIPNFIIRKKARFLVLIPIVSIK